MSSPLRRSSRHHPSSTAADRERETSTQRSPREGSSRKRRSETSREKEEQHSHSAKRDKRERESHKDRKRRSSEKGDKMNSHSLANSHASPHASSHTISPSKVEIKVGRSELENNSVRAPVPIYASVSALGPFTNKIATSYEQALLEEEGRDMARMLDKDEKELTVKEVIAKRMKNTRMRGLNRDLVKLTEKDGASVPRNKAESLESTINDVAKIAQQNASFGTVPSLETLQKSGGTLREALSQFLNRNTGNMENSYASPPSSRDAEMSESEQQRMDMSAENSRDRDDDYRDRFGAMVGNALILTPSPFNPTVMWQAICQLPSNLVTNESNEFNVDGHKYVRLTQILSEEGFTIPVTVPINIELPLGGKIVMPLCDGFKANRIPVKRRSIARWVYLVLRDANLLVHKSFLDLLFDYSGAVFNVALEREEGRPLHELPFVALAPPSDDVINACNGLFQARNGSGYVKKEYQYKPRLSNNSTFSSTPVRTALNSCISDPDFLKNYIAGLVDVEEPESGDSFDNPAASPSREDNNSGDLSGLTTQRKVLLISAFDSGVGFDQLAQQYGIDVDTVGEIIRNRVTIIREQAMQNKKNRVGVRRTSYVGLNIMMWKFFKDCRDRGIILSGKALKEHAKTLATKLGLESFKGSEGWLDAFKRRHKIDLRTMTGIPVIYEEDPESGDIVCPTDPDCDDLAEVGSPSPSSSPNPHGTTESLLAQATALVSVSVSDPKPLDLEQLGLTGMAVEGSLPPTHSYPNFVVGTPSGRSQTPPMINGHALYSPPSPSPAFGECQLIMSIMKSAGTHCPDKEVSSALETIRSFIMHKDPSMIPTFLDLQSRLCDLATVPNPPTVFQDFEMVNGDECMSGKENNIFQPKKEIQDIDLELPAQSPVDEEMNDSS